MTERYDDDVEFLTGADDPAGDDDVVEFGRRRVSGRVTTLAGLAIAASIVALLVARSDRHKPAARATPAPSSLTTQPGELLAPPGQGRALLLPSSPVVDGALAPGRLYTLQFSQLTVTAPAGSRGVSPDGLDFDRIGGAARLLVDDGPANRLWVVVMNTRDGQILEFDASTLRPLRRVSWPQPVSAAAVLLGTLYFSTPSGIASFGPAARTPVLVAALKGHSGPVVADPLRARLLVLDYATRSRLRAYRPGGALSAAVGEMGFADGSVVVTGDGRIWGAGSGPNGAVLSRLDAVTLQPSLLVLRLGGPGAVLVAAGNSDIWVRTAAVAAELFCVDGETGVENERWTDAAGRVTSRDGEAYLASGTTVRPLIMTGCAG